MEKKNLHESEDSVTEAAIMELCSLIKKADDVELTYDFFNCLFTKAELKEFSQRWLLVKEIAAGTTQREIAKKYGMSLCKITRGSKELNKPESAFRKMLDVLKS